MFVGLQFQTTTTCTFCSTGANIGKRLGSQLLPDLEELQLLLLAPEEGVFENTFRQRPPRRLHAQHLLDEISGHDVSW